jgi:hypothetical protein
MNNLGRFHKNFFALNRTLVVFVSARHFCPTQGAQKLTGENLKLVLGRVFSYKLGCFDDMHVLIYAVTCPHL